MRTSIRFSILLGFGLCGLWACGGEGEGYVEPVDTASEGIINGDAANPDTVGFPMLSNQVGGTYCTSVLLTNNWVLTAKHCVADVPAEQPDKIVLTLGTQVAHAESFLLNPDHDVALIKADAPFRMNGSTAGFVRDIYDGVDAKLNGKTVACYGYGRGTYTGNGQVFRSADLSITRTTSDLIRTSPNADDQIPWRGDSGGTCLHNGDAIGPQSFCNHTPTAQQVNHCEMVAPAAYRSWVMGTILTPEVKLGFRVQREGEWSSEWYETGASWSDHYGDQSVFYSGDWGFSPSDSCTADSLAYSTDCRVFKASVCDVLGPHAGNADGIHTRMNAGQSLGVVGQGWTASYFDREQDVWREWKAGSPPKTNALDKAWNQAGTNWYHAQEWEDINDWDYPETSYGCSPVTRYGWWDGPNLRVIELHHCVRVC